MDELAEQLASRLEADPSDVQAYEALKAHYLRTEDFASLTNLIAGWAGYQSDPHRASRGYYEASQVVARAAPEHERRLALLRQAVALDANYRDALFDLIALLPRVRDEQTLAGFLEEHLATLEERHGDSALMAELYAQLAGLWATQLHQPDASRRCYERSLDLAPTLACVESARAVARSSGDKQLLVLALEAEAALEADPLRKATLYHTLADALTHDTPNWDEVVKALQQAHNLAPIDPDLSRQLADAYVQRAGSQSGDAADSDRKRAADLRYQVAQGLPPADALPLLQAALRAQPDHEEGLELLERHADQLGQEALLPQFWLDYMSHAQPGPGLDRRRVAMAKVYERVGKLDEAIECLEQVHDAALASNLLTELKVRRGPRSQPLRLSSSLRPPPDHPSGNLGPSDGAIRPERRLDVEPTVRELRRGLRNAIATHQQSEVVARCREIIQHQPNDLAAFTLLESYYRRTEQPQELLQLLVESLKAEGLSLAERRLRLRELAWINERKLRDSDAAIQAWRSVLAVDASDQQASRSLKRLLRQTHKWHELAQTLEHEAAATSDGSSRVATLTQLATVQRDQLHDRSRAADSLRELYALQPDAMTRRQLCEALLETEAYADAAPLLRKRIHAARGERERLFLLRQLADILDNRLQEPEAAFDVCDQILALRPNDADTLARMQRIDEQSGNAERLLRTLARRCELLPRKPRAALFLEMAQIAESAVNDIEAAGRYYRAAYELDPERSGTLDALCGLFECRELHARLVSLLTSMLETTRDPQRRVELGLRKARLLAGSLGASGTAAEAYREVLRHEESVEALRYLLKLAREQHDADTTAALCARLAATLEDRSECRALLYERAQLLVTELGRPRDAIVTLRNIVEEVDPEYEPAIEWLAELAGNLGDNVGVASALWRRLAKSQTADARVALARRLADLSEHELDDKDAAVAALTQWAQADPHDVIPQRRLRRLLEETGRYQELAATCEALAELETEPAARDEASLRAAQIAASQLRSPDAAWQRLAPMVARGQPKAIELLSSIARQSRRFEELATLYVQAAQETDNVELQKQLWSHATRTYREELGQPDKALDAALRLLASDLGDRDALAQIEEAVAQSGQWSRLSNVYGRLIKAAAHDAERTQLLVRYADLLELRAGNPDEALDLILQACALSPDDELLLAQAERLALACDRSADLLALCDRQAASASEPSAQLEWLLRGARFASSTAEDSSATYAYLEHALAAAGADATLWERCVVLAQRLDAKTPEDQHHRHLHALIAAHRRVAEHSPAAVGADLMRRASRLMEEKLADERAAFDVLRAGATLFPLDEDIYDSLLERAEASGHLDALDAHLARGADEALDPRTAACLLARRARLLEGPLGRPEDAANVYAKLLQLRPDDQQAASKLRDSLRRARRFQDLLLVIHKQTLRAKQPHEKVELLKETAHVWELDLRNRWEAVDAWSKVLELAPDDNEALRAIARLDRRSGPPSAARAAQRDKSPAAEPLVSEDLARAAPAAPKSEPPAPSTREVDAEEILEDDASLELLSVEDAEPVSPSASPARRSAPPPPPPQALGSSKPRPKTSAPPPPPPPKPRSS